MANPRKSYCLENPHGQKRDWWPMKGRKETQACMQPERSAHCAQRRQLPRAPSRPRGGCGLCQPWLVPALSVNPWMGRWQGDCMKRQSDLCWIRRLGTEPGNMWWTGSTHSVLRTHGHSDGDASGTAVWGWGAFSGTLARGLKDKEGFSGDCWGDSTYTHRHRHPGVRKIPWRRRWQPTPVFYGFWGAWHPISAFFFSPWKNVYKI